MLQSRMHRQIPERLSHYTSLVALKSILSEEDGKGVCFWAFSNKCKNDDQEIKMGEYMLKRVRKALPTKSSLLHQLSGYGNTASVSFMEGDVNQHMLDVYGRYRLEFDLRKVGLGILFEGLVDCEYVDANALEEYADEYCALISSILKSIPELQKKYGETSAPPINNLGDVTWLVLLIVYGVDGCCTIVHRIMLHENMGQAHRKHLYQLMANELKIGHMKVSTFYMLLQMVISLVFIWVIPSTVLWHWVYAVAVMALLACAYVLFMRKYYHLHAEYLASLKSLNK